MRPTSVSRRRGSLAGGARLVRWSTGAALVPALGATALAASAAPATRLAGTLALGLVATVVLGVAGRPRASEVTARRVLGLGVVLLAASVALGVDPRRLAGGTLVLVGVEGIACYLAFELAELARHRGVALQHERGVAVPRIVAVTAVAVLGSGLGVIVASLSTTLRATGTLGLSIGALAACLVLVLLVAVARSQRLFMNEPDR